MKRAISNILCTLSIFFVSCSPSAEKGENERNKPVELSDFPSIIDLNQIDSIRTPPTLFKVKRLISTNDYIIALGSSKDTVFRVFDAPTGKYLGGFGYLGPGPLDLEFESVASSGISPTQNGFVVGDLKRLRKYEFQNSEREFSSANVRLLNNWKIPGELFPFGSPHLLGDSVMIGHVQLSNKHLVQVSLKNREIKDIFDFPNDHPEIPPTALSQLYQSTRISASIDGSKVAVAYKNFPQVRILNFTNEEIKDIYFAPKHEQIKNINVGPQKKSIDNSTLFNYYLSTEVSNNRIYAYYSERSYERNDQGTRKTIKYNEPELHVYDWSGKPISRIMLPPNVIYYTITPDDKYLYFVKIDTDNYIYRYKL